MKVNLLSQTVFCPTGKYIEYLPNSSVLPSEAFCRVSATQLCSSTLFLVTTLAIFGSLYKTPIYTPIVNLQI